MAIISAVANQDDPTLQNSGQWRGQGVYTFDDGRIVSRRITAGSEAEWNQKLQDMIPEIELQVQQQDAENAVVVGNQIAASGQASAEQVGYAYFTASYASDDPYQAYLLFNEYERWAKDDMGWNNDSQMLAGMASTGLTQDEWDVKTGSPGAEGLNWISDPGQVNKMEAVQSVNQTWADRIDY